MSFQTQLSLLFSSEPTEPALTELTSVSAVWVRPIKTEVQPSPQEATG